MTRGEFFLAVCGALTLGKMPKPADYPMVVSMSGDDGTWYPHYNKRNGKYFIESMSWVPRA